MADPFETSPRIGDLIVYGPAYIAPMGILSTLGFVWTESHDAAEPTRELEKDLE